MKVFRGLPSADSRSPCVLTIGNFDGVHRGHQALLAQLRKQADARGLPACVMTFEPHPREFFSPTSAPARVATLRDKMTALAQYGVDRVIVEHFNARFAALSPQAFIQDILVNGCHAKWIMVGDDFRFGAKRAGGFAMLKAAGFEHGFDVEQMQTVTDAQERISSSAVRAALAAGDLTRAAQLLGHPYHISGHVLHGQKLGRTLGFPTLNVRFGSAPALNGQSSLHSTRTAPMMGIFVVQVHGLAAHPLPAVASLGVRPTVEDNGRVLLETHVFDWAGDAYGKLIRVDFLHKLRDEQKYDNLDQLKDAIAQDAANARAYLAQHHARGTVTHLEAIPHSSNTIGGATDRISAAA